jgi:hypothetical protein
MKYSQVTSAASVAMVEAAGRGVEPDEPRQSAEINCLAIRACRFLGLFTSPAGLSTVIGDKAALPGTGSGVRPVGQGGGRRAVRRRLRPNEPKGSAEINDLAIRSGRCLGHRCLSGRSLHGCRGEAALPGVRSGARPVGQGGGVGAVRRRL